MAYNERVVWSEGMFIRAQHFQQEARYLEHLVQARARPLRSFGWGLAEFRLNKELLSIGQFGIEAASGLFADGTPFAIPNNGSMITPLILDESIRNSVIYLTLPINQPGSRESASSDGGEVLTRYVATEVEVPDVASDDNATASLEVGRLRLRYALEGQDLGGQSVIPLARIIEVRADNSVVLDDTFIPPVLDCAASRVLAGYLTEIVGLLNHRGQAVASRLQGSSIGTASEFTDLMMLVAINRAQPVFAHLANSGGVHPETLFQAALGLAGEMSTFASATRRPPAFPVYQHDRLEACFHVVIATIRQALSAVLERNAINIPLTEHRFGIRVADVQDRSFFNRFTFVLAAKADMATDTLVRKLVGQIKIGPVEQISELVNAALPGIMVRPLPSAPRQIPYQAGKAYFEMDRSSAIWKQLAVGKGLAIHLGGDFPALELDLWAVKD